MNRQAVQLGRIEEPVRRTRRDRPMFQIASEPRTTVRFLFLFKTATGIEVLSYGSEKNNYVSDGCKLFTKSAQS